MTVRTLAVAPLAWVLACVGLLQVSAGSGQVQAVVLVTTAMVCGLLTHLLASRSAPVRPVKVVEPAARRLHGSFQQQSRPGVPGRIQARAPGDQH